MQTVFSKVNNSLRFWEAPEPRWAEPADVQDVNACMHVDTGTDFHLTSVKEPRAFWELGVRSDKAVDSIWVKTPQNSPFVHKQSGWKEFWLNKKQKNPITSAVSCFTSSILLYENDKSNKYLKHTIIVASLQNLLTFFMIHYSQYRLTRL